jgi:hypothetical protein
MELEVKHLAPYLPYGLKLQYVVRDVVQSTGIMKSISHNDFETHPTRVNINYQGEEHIWMFRPMLRPLSKIAEEINHDNQFFVPIETLDMDFLQFEYFHSEKGLDLSKVTYNDVLRLLSWHFDIFGLIPAGLATELS